MFLSRFIRTADDVTKDVGQELKRTALKIYEVGYAIYWLLLILELIAVLLGWLNLVFESFWLIFSIIPIAIGFVIAAIIQYALIIGPVYRITIEMFARGESVHYLRAISQQGLSSNKNVAAEETAAVKPMKENAVKSAQQTVAESAQETTIEPAQETVVKVVREVVVPTTVGWLCKNCGTQNKIVHGQCKKCGTYRSYETSEDVIEPQLRTELVEEEIAPPVSAKEPKKCEDGKTLAQIIAEKVFVQDENRPEVHLDDNWICSGCGTTNAMKYGQCKKCGKFKNS